MTKTTHIFVLAFAALLLVTGCSGGADQDSTGAASAVTMESSPPVGYEDSGGKDVAVASVPGVPAVGEKVITNASIRLTVPRGEFDEAIQEARMIAAGAGGFVVSSETSRPKPGKPMRGSIVVRVPEKAYATALGSLESLGRVESRQESSTSVTAEYIDLKARVRHLEAVERQLLALLDKAESVEDALAVQATLNDTQLQLEEARGQLRYLDNQTAYATISIALAERTAPVAAAGGSGIVDAWRDGAEAFLGVAAWTFVALATIAPLALLAVLVFGAVWFTRRRRLHAA
jgi:Domain of unknown function (DUF4349)